MKFLSIFIILASLTMTASCKKYFDGKNTDPDNPLTVPPNIVLPGIQATLCYSMGGDASRYASIYTQHITGVSRQWAVLQDYKFFGEDVNTLFEDNLYADVLVEINRMKSYSTEKGYHYYNGIGKTMEAYTLLFIADFWNSAPYSQAFQGLNELQPRYDSQSELYTSIFNLITEAKADFNQPDGGDLIPGSDDLIYGGDIPSWVGFLSFVEARAYLHLAKNDPSKYQDALNALSGGGLVTDAAYQFGPEHRNPMFQFNQERGDCSVGGFLSNLVTTLNDPRAALYNQDFTEDNTFLTDSRSFFLATKAEQHFILAECNFQLSGSGAAYQNYLDGINASLTGYGLSSSAAAYLGQAAVDPGSGSLTLELIMTQKYIALFMEPELFNDWRRTGFPVLTPNAGSTIPRRFPYPQQELNLNQNTPQATIYSPVDWDN